MNVDIVNKHFFCVVFRIAFDYDSGIKLGKVFCIRGFSVCRFPEFEVFVVLEYLKNILNFAQNFCKPGFFDSNAFFGI